MRTSGQVPVPEPQCKKAQAPNERIISTLCTTIWQTAKPPLIAEDSVSVSPSKIQLSMRYRPPIRPVCSGVAWKKLEPCLQAVSKGVSQYIGRPSKRFNGGFTGVGRCLRRHHQVGLFDAQACHLFMSRSQNVLRILLWSQGERDCAVYWR